MPGQGSFTTLTLFSSVPGRRTPKTFELLANRRKEASVCVSLCAKLCAGYGDIRRFVYFCPHCCYGWGDLAEVSGTCSSFLSEEV